MRFSSNSVIDYPSTPAAPRFALIRLYASQTSRLEMLNGFARSLAFIPSLVDTNELLDNAAPSLELAFTNRHHCRVNQPSLTFIPTDPGVRLSRTGLFWKISCCCTASRCEVIPAFVNDGTRQREYREHSLEARPGHS